MIRPEKTKEYLSRYLVGDVAAFVPDFERSFGNRLVNQINGKPYLDCFTYIASNPIGHNHPKLNDPKFERLLLRVAKTNPSNSDFWSVEMAEFVETFVRVLLPREFNHLFFIQGGALAVENALKAAFDWKVRKNFMRGYKEEKGTQVIHFEQAFHGRSGYTMSLTNTRDLRKVKYYPKFKWPRIINPKIRFPLDGKNLKEVIALEQQALAQIKDAFIKNKDDIAAIIIEPIQGEGGDNHFRAEFHQMLRTLADENEALLIYDEVQSGVGLTGRTWCYQHYGIVPDIVSFGKKTQVCGMFSSPRIEEVENHVFKEPSRINSTWGGDLTGMVRVKRYLEIIEEDMLVENAARVGAVLQEKLRGLCSEFPEVFSNARGEGLMCAIDADTEARRDLIVAGLYEREVLVLKCAEKTIRLRPPLTFIVSEVEELVEKMRQVLVQH